MKNLRKPLLMIALLLCGTFINAHNFEVGGIYYNITSSPDLTVEVTYKGDNSSYNHKTYSGAIVIPETVTYDGNTYTVTEIGRYAFYECSITSVTLPNTLELIELDAFYGCQYLTGVTLPNSLKTIEHNAFSGCHKIKSLIIPDGVTNIGSGAFRNCAGLESVVLSKSMTTLETSIFEKCSSLSSVSIPASITRVSEKAFYDCI